MKTFAIAVFFIFLASCSSKPEIDLNSEPYVNPDKFAEILKDYALTESALNLNIRAVDELKYDSAYNFNILLKHKVSKVAYDTTMKYYASNPEEFKTLMESVLEKLNMEKAQ